MAVPRDDADWVGRATGSVRPRPPFWMSATLGLFVLLVAGFLLWQLRVGHLVVGDTHRRNFHALEVAANGLEYWPTALRGVAVANFIPDAKPDAQSAIAKALAAQHSGATRDTDALIPEASATRRSEGWHWAKSLRHPVLEQYELLFRIEKPGGCKAFRDRVQARERMRLPFIDSNRSGEGPQLKIIDSLPLIDLWVLDHVAGATLPQVRLNIVGLRGDQALDAELCYGAVVPIEQLLGAESPFSTLLIVDSDRRVVQQVGSRQVPVETLSGLVPSTSVLSETVASMVAGKVVKSADPKPLVDKLEPVPLRIADVDYRAYVRMFRLPPGIQGCEPRAKDAEARPVAVDTSPSCFLVGLVPASGITQSAVRPSPFFIAMLTVSLIILLASLPALRLLLSGPADAIPVSVARLIMPGTLVLASVLTYTVLFGFDLARTRESREAIAYGTAVAMAKQTGAEIAIAVEMADEGAAQFAATLLPDVPHDTGLSQAITPVSKRESAETQTWPRLVSIAALDSGGRPLACGSRQLAFRGGGNARFQVGGRKYFQRLLAGDFDNPRVMQSAEGEKFDGSVTAAPMPSYTVDELRAQTDGISRLILALDGPEWLKKHAIPQGACELRALLATGLLSELTAPVLPTGLSFVVAAADRPELPVLFHNIQARAGAEDFATELDGAGLRTLRRWTNLDRDGPPLVFEARYDGARRHFVAARIPGTSWIVLVSYRIDLAASHSAWLLKTSLVTGAMLAIPLFFCFGALHAVAPGLFRNFWPHERRLRGGGYLYRHSWLVLGALFAVQLIAPALLPIYLVVPATLTIALCAILWLSGRHSRGGDVGLALTPITERRYQRMLFCILLVVSVGPSLAIWSEARQAQAAMGSSDLAASTSAWDRQQATVDSLVRAVSPERTPGDAALKNAMQVSYRVIGFSPPGDASDLIVSRVATLLGYGSHARQREPASSKDEATAREIDPTQAPPSSKGQVRRVLLGLFTLLCALGIWRLIQVLLVAVAGFGVPLEAVKRPKLDLRDEPRVEAQSVAEAMRAGRRTLIVGTPFPVLAWLRERLWNVCDLTRSDELVLFLQSGNVVAINLHLVLRDAEKRRAALELLEALDRDMAPNRKLIVLSSLAPLERILDAYERDRRNPEEGPTLSKNREQLRWASLFERFNTFAFASKEPKIRVPLRMGDRSWRAMLQVYRRWLNHSWKAFRGENHDASIAQRDARRAVAAILRELAWLPEDLIATTIGVDDLQQRLEDRITSTPDADPPGVFPVKESHWRRLLSRDAINWARRLDAPSVEAAVDHLRAILIEHYQKSWSASSYAERVLLDHLARGRVINVQSAHIPLASLVRRNLVIFDPVPRLVNKSFRRFVLQAERPDRIRWWRTLQPVSAWAKARWPLLIAVPVILLLLLAMLGWSDRNLLSLLPIIAAGGAPVLFAAILRSIRTQLGAS